ncbi:ABC transporter ATP-binding protein [Bradyrhizobium canariense]|uniref:NitT/TauT family transport system ATP-binding protein n=1 Tax=Bradyrhizobium canariense TaxID=255045 RepID=A0A1H2BIP9_9BRAD|nr:ABC transporter ATP-binding protein [Bradyrhizobium canariense]SDT58135.1 NitT/TauT family transport system ATP-binding protein [Bradyrhizobium canariense]
MLRINDVSKRFVGRDKITTAIEGVTLDVAAGEFITLVGPSGCGKSTILNIISGLMPATEGETIVDGKILRGVTRDVGYVTQQPNLMPWRNLIDNVSFPLEIDGVSRPERYRRARELIRLVGLEGFEGAYPNELSGGMRQRANIVRTMIYEPKVILMDEPFGPLDAQTRVVLQDLLLNLWTRTGVTIVFITHDLQEAIGLGDRVVLLSARPGRVARIEQVPLPRPRDVFKMHDSREFRELYDRLWLELERQVKGSHV